MAVQYPYRKNGLQAKGGGALNMEKRENLNGTGRDGAVLLRVEHLSVSFNQFKAIDDVSLAVNRGELRVIIGPNGAGKTTLMDLITGKTRPTAGKIILNGHDITGRSESEIASRHKIGRKFQGPNLFDSMTAYENIEVALKGYCSLARSFFFRKNRRIEQKINEVLQSVSLYEKREVMASFLSHGERQWLEIGMVMAQDPELIILDEPTAGMTADETRKTGEMILRLLGDHTVIVVEHDMDFVRQVARTVTVLHQGQLLAEGPYGEIEKDPRVIQVYLKDDKAGEEAACSQ